ncbi:MAG: Gfo/Idh/MocA family oxidoreductase [Planctomycetota bacterium]|nr:Gfo/Idh/MocA family oxidoreductase [Planctomycetota bacterium]
MKQAPLTVAIVGCHRMLARDPACHNWAAAIDAVPETRIASVSDLGEATRDEFIQCWGEVPSFDDYDQLLDQMQPDVVCIATRQTMHAGQIEKAVASGAKGILCDKPLTTSLAEMDRIVTACRSSKVPLAFGLDRAWWPSYRKLRQLLADGIIGEMTGLIAGGLPNLINHGCHWYDSLLHLAGDPEPVWVSGLVDPSESADPAGMAEIGFSSGLVASVIPAGRLGMSFDILGTEGRILCLRDSQECYLWRKATEGHERINLPPNEEGWPAGPESVRDLVQAIQTGGGTACDLDHARRATEIGFAIHLSHAANGKRISLPAAERDHVIESFPWGNE